MRPRSAQQKRGFTYIEMLVIVAITVILSALVMPNMLSDKKRKQVWDFRTRLQALGTEARSRAIQSGEPIGLQFAKDPDTLKLLMQTDTGTPVELRALPVPDSVKSSKFMTDSSQGSGDQWIVTFYSDGTSAGGGIEFDDSGAPFNLTIGPSDAVAKVQDGPMPDLSLDRWPAGTYAKR